MSNNAAHDRLVRAGKLWLSQQGCMVADTQASGLVYSLSGHKMRAGLKGKPDITATVPPHGRALAAEALCHEVRAEYGQAYNTLSRALEFAPPQTSPAGAAAPWPKLRADLLRIEGRVARVLVTFPDGASLWVDGRPVAGVSGRVLAIDPGRRLFEARGRDGATVAAAEVDARAGDVPAVHLAAPLQSLSQPSSTAISSPRTTPEPLPSQPLSTPHPLAPALSPRGAAVTVAYVGLGTALVAGVVAGVLEAQRSALRSGLAPDACPTPDASTRCAELRQVYQQSRGARDAALVAGGIGLAAAGVGLGVWLGLERGRSAPASAGLTIGGAW